MPRAPRLPILIALVCALFVRALVPTGWMPAEGRGLFAIELCPAAGPAAMVGMDQRHGGMPADRGSHKDQHGDCAFSPLHAGFAPADAVASFAAPLVGMEAPANASAAHPFTTDPPSLPPPATGPPALA